MNGTYTKAERTKGKKLRQSARNQDCTLRFFTVCNYDPETTVLAHGKKNK
ncbi:MAG: nuclease domain-containing protein, partial [Burkholderiales bacterium]